MSHQLVRERTTHALDEQRVVRVLEHGAMTLLLDIVEIIARRPLRRVVLAHVADPTREFGEALSISALADPVHRQMLGRRERRSREEGDRGLVVEMRHEGKRGGKEGHEVTKQDASGRGVNWWPRAATPAESARTPAPVPLARAL